MPRPKKHSSLPKGYHLVDPARSARQAEQLMRAYPKDARALIVKTGKGRGKNRDVFPYHIASDNPVY